MNCEHCFLAGDITLPSGVSVCGQCFVELYCRSCWNHHNVVGTITPYNGTTMCASCINNTPPEPVVHFGDIDDDIYDEPPYDIDNIYDQPPNDIYYNILPINIFQNIDNIPHDEIYNIIPIDPIEPHANFDMNSASVVEHNPDYMNNLVNAQIEYNGLWYFALDNQIYSVPYEIEVDDDYVREDIRDNWDGVLWAGAIFGEYIAWR